MAPEILNETLDQTSIDAFRQADVYAFALVMWEVFKRISWNGEYKYTVYCIYAYLIFFINKLLCAHETFFFVYLINFFSIPFQRR